MEVVEEYAGIAYRLVYTTSFEKAVYVLHAFEKKSRTGIRTPRHQVDVIRRRYRAAERQYKEEWRE